MPVQRKQTDNTYLGSSNIFINYPILSFLSDRDFLYSSDFDHLQTPFCTWNSVLSYTFEGAFGGKINKYKILIIYFEVLRSQPIKMLKFFRAKKNNPVDVEVVAIKNTWCLLRARCFCEQVYRHIVINNKATPMRPVSLSPPSKSASV